jgi:PAS domain S-box-containing protein
LDITARRAAERQLRESEERFRLMAQTAPALIWMSTADGRPTFFNAEWIEFTGRSLDEAIGEGATSALHPDDRASFMEAYGRAIDARAGFQIEYRLRRRDGEYRWITGRAVPQFDAQGTLAGYISSGIDITERKLAETWREQLGGRLIEAQERERARIARELHDDFGQRVASFSIALSRVKRELPQTSGPLSESLAELQRQVVSLGSDLRHLSHDLHPAALEHLGLLEALRARCQEFSAETAVPVQFDVSDAWRDVSDPVALCLYRVAQEALRNVAAHAQARHVVVSLDRHNGHLVMQVLDDGVGLAERRPSGRSGLGLVSLGERVRMLGGVVRVTAAPNAGTRLTVTLPLGVPRAT